MNPNFSDDPQATNGNDGNGRQSNGYGGTLSVCGTTMSGSKGGEYLQIPDPESQVDYKSGWVMRKCVYDSDGKRSKTNYIIDCINTHILLFSTIWSSIVENVLRNIERHGIVFASR
jgi:hypothetical protein